MTGEAAAGASGVIDTLTRHLVSRGTAVETHIPHSASVMDDQRWHQTFRDSVEDRLVQPLVAAMAAGDLLSAESRYTQALAAHRSAMAVCLLLDRALVTTSDALDRAGVPTRVVGGASIASLDFPAQEMRQYGDVDLLVPAPQLDQAVKVLEDIGMACVYRNTEAIVIRERLSDGVAAFVWTGLSVRLHTALTPGQGSNSEVRWAWEASEPFSIGGTTVFSLSRPARLIWSAIRLGVPSRSLRLWIVRDLLMQCGVAGPSDVAMLAASSDSIRVLEQALQMLDGLGIRRPGGWDGWSP